MSAGADVEHGNGVVLLERHERRVAVSCDRNRFGLDVLSHGGGHPGLAGDADAAVDQLGLAVVPGAEVNGLHLGLGRGHRGGGKVAGGVDQRNGADRIDGVVATHHTTRLTLVGDYQLLAVGAELHHVGQGADRDRADVDRQRRVAQVVELNKAWISFDCVLNGNRQQLSINGSALKG